jgi:hypothetical protein
VTYNKTIVCLANSRKHSGRCVAGREVIRGGYSSWIRPISGRPYGEISEEDSRYENGQAPQVLDIIRIPMLTPAGQTYQRENHVIDDRYYWEKVGTGDWRVVVGLLENASGPLWVDGHSTYNGLNDQVPEAGALTLDRSLILAACRPTNPGPPGRRCLRPCKKTGSRKLLAWAPSLSPSGYGPRSGGTLLGSQGRILPDTGGGLMH